MEDSRALLESDFLKSLSEPKDSQFDIKLTQILPSFGRHLL